MRLRTLARKQLIWMVASTIGAAVTVFSGLNVAPAEAASSLCRDAVKAGDQAANDFRRSARGVSQDCTVDAQLCDSAMTALRTSLSDLQATSDVVLAACRISTTPGEGIPGPGDLVITEVNVVSERGAAHQWVEVFNTTDKVLDLTGLTLTWVTGNFFPEPRSGVLIGPIQPHSFLVLAFPGAQIALAQDFGIRTGLIQGGPLSPFDRDGGFNFDSPITILNGPIVIDSVSWRDDPFAESELRLARQLDPDMFQASLNDRVNKPGEKGVWCSATLTYGTTIRAYGTPGGENTQCPGVGPTP